MVKRSDRLPESSSHIDLSIYRNHLKIKDGRYVWDICRRKWLVITPEEIVRQCLCLFLNLENDVPYSFMNTEHGLMYGKIKKRADVLVYNKKGNPYIIAECKSPDIELSDSTILQMLSYSREIPTEYYIISNGRQTYFFKKKKSSLEIINRLPKFDEIC